MEDASAVRLLIVEDSGDDAALVAHWLRKGGLRVTYRRVETARAMTEALRYDPPDLVISDCKMPEFTAGEALEVIRDSGLDVPCIVVSGQIGEEAAVGLMRAGARDFVLKDNPTRLVATVERELREAAARREQEKAREELEHQLHQAERLDSLGQLAGGIAHDFNNLIGVIKGCAELALADLPDDHPCRPDVATIDQVADQAAALTRQLLIFSRLQPAQPETLDPNAVIKQTARLLQRALGEDIDLVTTLDPALDAVTIDRSRLEQVVMNLAVNARAAMPAGGRLLIQTANEDAAGPDRAAGLPEGRLVRLSCTDTGCGMSAEVARRAFEPFFTTKGPGAGSGLGLATVYGAVKEAQGAVTLWSEPGAGTRVDVYLPSAGRLTAVAAPGERQLGRAPGNAEHILIVEDNHPIAEVARRILTGAGYRVTVTTSRREALRLTADRGVHVDLLLSDVVMPGMPAEEFIRLVRATRPGIPVLLMSGYAASYARAGAEGTALPLMSKPFNSATLLRKVHAVLSGRPDTPPTTAPG
jgi:signal transduction histidine kinase